MATYTLTEAPELIVSVRGKDSINTRNKALEKINEMAVSGELNTELPDSLNTEQLILTEATVKTTDTDGDEEQEPLEMAVCELQKCLLIKLRTQRLKQSATQARQNIATVLTEESTEQDLDQMEEMLKGNFKTLKDYVNALREFRQARPGAEEALAILDEALQVNLSISAISNPKTNLSTEFEISPPQPEASEAKNDINNEVSTAITGVKPRYVQNGT
ncbi:MAG: hypothetical protein JO235_27610 [Chroococcidiopsidaceae cyanobacterium CP_BM_RX_35]|nr:hypothetical protein [Chroococcidiopsidaceae cyanobacterium CP_BM_RX_35]